MNLLERAFGRPVGLLGRGGGVLMARGNAPTERHLVQLADLGPTDTVLVVGPGPGIGTAEAARRAAHVVAVEPSEVMRRATARRCRRAVEDGTVAVRGGTAASTGQPAESVDAVLSVNTVMLWPDWAEGFDELYRVVRPGGRMLLSAHERWLPGGADALAAAVSAAGFDDVVTWLWEPPSRGASTAVALRARRPEPEASGDEGAR